MLTDEHKRLTTKGLRHLIQVSETFKCTEAYCLVDAENKGGSLLAAKFGFEQLRIVPWGELDNYRRMRLMRRGGLNDIS